MDRIRLLGLLALVVLLLAEVIFLTVRCLLLTPTAVFLLDTPLLFDEFIRRRDAVIVRRAVLRRFFFAFELDLEGRRDIGC